MKPWLAQRALDREDALAVRVGDVTLSYAEMGREVMRRAEGLRSRGVGRGSKVAIFGQNSLEWVLCAHAAFWLGATLVPLHPRASAAELDFQLAAVELDLVLFDQPSPAFDAAEVPALPFGEVRAPDGAECRPANISLDDVLTVLFTSGTSGRPKAVPLTVDNHLSSASASSTRLGLCEDDHWLCCLPLCHIGGLAIVLRSAIYGTSFELLGSFSTDRVIETLRTRPVTLASFVPTMVDRVLEAAPGAIDSTLRAVLVGGGPIEEDLLVEARRRGVPALPTYGMSEASSQLATLSPHADDSRLGSAGTPLDGVELRLVREDGSSCEPGESGAIWARGPMLTKGYLLTSDDRDAEDINAERFRDGWFRTGDVGRVDEDGFLYIEHRKSDLIVSGGENVDPKEVERALREDAAVRDVAVVGLDDRQWGQVVGALIVADAGEAPDALVSRLEARCREQLAAFKVPRRWAVCDALPRTEAQKIRRDQVRSLIEDGAARLHPKLHQDKQHLSQQRGSQ